MLRTPGSARAWNAGWPVSTLGDLAALDSALGSALAIMSSSLKRLEDGGFVCGTQGAVRTQSDCCGRDGTGVRRLAAVH